MRTQAHTHSHMLTMGLLTMQTVMSEDYSKEIFSYRFSPSFSVAFENDHFRT